MREGLAATQVTTNGYLEILQNFGLIGFSFWFILIVYLFSRKFSSAVKNPSMQKVAGVAIVIAMLFYYNVEGGLVSIGNIASIYFWIELSRKEE